MPNTLNTCNQCGAPIDSNAKSCKFCGGNITISQAAQTTQPAYSQPVITQYPYMFQLNIVQVLYNKIRKLSTIWIIVGICQILFALAFFLPYTTSTNVSTYSYETNSYVTTASSTSSSPFSVVMIVFLFFAIFNFIIAAKNRKFANRILTNPVGIVKHYRPVGGSIVYLICNLFVGHFLGIAGGIYALTIRSYVMSNTLQFLHVEQSFNGQQ